LAQRLLADGEHVVDVPAKLSARARLLDTGHNRKTDAHDAHAVAVVAVRTKNLRVLAYDADLEVLRMLVDRRDELSRAKVQCINRLHRLLSELVPGQGKKDLTAVQAKAILASARPRDPVRKTLKRLALEQLAELMVIEKKIKDSSRELKTLVIARGSHLMDLTGVGPVVAARILADVGDVARFTDRNRFASWTGTAPPGRLLRGADPPPALPRRQPKGQPRHPHRRRQPDPPRQSRPRLLPAQARRREDPAGSPALPHWMSMGTQVRLACSSGTARDGLDVSPLDGLFELVGKSPAEWWALRSPRC
jgi:hypothetical protein